MNPDGLIGGNGLPALASLRRYVRPRAAPCASAATSAMRPWRPSTRT